MRPSKTTHDERIVKDIKRKTRKQYSAEESERSAIDSRNSEPVSCSTVYGAKRVLRSFATEKASHKAYIINGPRTSWRLVKSV